jgi:hypothetical protein
MTCLILFQSLATVAKRKSMMLIATILSICLISRSLIKLWMSRFNFFTFSSFCVYSLLNLWLPCSLVPDFAFTYSFFCSCDIFQHKCQSTLRNAGFFVRWKSSKRYHFDQSRYYSQTAWRLSIMWINNWRRCSALRIQGVRFFLYACFINPFCIALIRPLLSFSAADRILISFILAGSILIAITPTSFPSLIFIKLELCKHSILLSSQLSLTEIT